ncbi:unnamed protein product [Leptidea sinapis]|uniref:Uncharacterized protein n=1 Tax=Leptidea sinapis TaxID=189913 RepID=A0A5E4PXX0_9NEOP|nr:unnamed protein product [Leptidea sinapis]
MRYTLNSQLIVYC